MIKDDEIRRRRVAARFNWHVMYTLLHNPDIRVMRKGYVQVPLFTLKCNLFIASFRLHVNNLGFYQISFHYSNRCYVVCIKHQQYRCWTDRLTSKNNLGIYVII